MRGRRIGFCVRKLVLGMALVWAAGAVGAAPCAASERILSDRAVLSGASADKGISTVDARSVRLEAKKPATKITMPVKRTVTAGLKARIQAKVVNSGESLTGLTWKSSNPKVATVSCTGIVLGYKAGTTTVTCRLKNGKTYKCAVTVKANVYNEKPFGKIKFQKNGTIEFAAVKYYYSGNTLKAVFGIYNGKSETLDYFSEVKFKIYGPKNETLFSGTVKNIALNMKPGTKKQVTFNLPVKNRTRYNLAKISSIGYEYSFHYYAK